MLRPLEAAQALVDAVAERGQDLGLDDALRLLEREGFVTLSHPAYGILRAEPTRLLSWYADEDELLWHMERFLPRLKS